MKLLLQTGSLLLLGLILVASCSRGKSDETKVLIATDFGLVADGVTDDGPAIQKLLDAARAAKQPVTIRFPDKKQIFVATGTERYAFRLDSLEGLGIDGGESTFLVHRDLRFLKATSCENLKIGFLNIDVTPSPVAEAVVIDQAESGKKLKVRLNDAARIGALGGPTSQDGEQAFFGMIWLKGKYATESEHYYFQKVTPVPGEPGVVWLEGEKNLPEWVLGKLALGSTKVSLPIPGVAHRHGPGAMTVIDGCKNVQVEQMETWSAPWFAWEILRNSGELVFRNTHIRPQPGSGRITSSWRDGFHVKGNCGKLLFEGCVLEGMNDDAFNISTHGWRVIDVPAPDLVLVRQIFPIQYMPMQVGGNAFVLSADGTRRLAPAGIREIREIFRKGDRPDLAPDLELLLDRKLEGLAKDCVVWDMSTSNLDTTIRRCRIGNSCRFQSPVTLDGCESDALLFFYSDTVEGPFPSGSVVRNCVLRQGRGNLSNAIAIQGWREGTTASGTPASASAMPLSNIRFENNQIHGGVSASHAASLVFRNNHFSEGPAALSSSDCPRLVAK
ncbi:MAG: hypothetical protein ACRCXD_13135 [Luteolibacter sp.]